MTIENSIVDRREGYRGIADEYAVTDEQNYSSLKDHVELNDFRFDKLDVAKGDATYSPMFESLGRYGDINYYESAVKKCYSYRSYMTLPQP